MREGLADTGEFRGILITMHSEPPVIILRVFLKYIQRRYFPLPSCPIVTLPDPLSDGLLPLF